MLGRQVSATDPDNGTTTRTYDDAGQLLSSTDARGKAAWFTYDALGRRTTESGTQGGAARASWSYDSSGAKGYLSSSTRVAGGEQYVTKITGYDAGYRPTAVSVTLPASVGLGTTPFETGYTYTIDGQLKTTKLPKLGNLPAETVYQYYDALSQPRAMGGGPMMGVYVAETTYSSYGDVLRLDLGNSYSYLLNNEYENGTGGSPTRL